MKKLDRKTVQAALPTLPGWQLRRGQLVLTREFTDFKDALRHVNAVGRVAEKMGHHPDIDIRWNRVRLTLVTHSAGGLTELDLDLAGRLLKLD